MKPRLVAALLFAVFAAVYWLSVPHAFNTVRSNERLFGSDGEFITRQFHQGSTFTHNDHLLYHVLARGLYRAAPAIPGLAQDPVPVHKWMSVLAGAAGVALLYLFGARYTGRPAPALVLALLVGGMSAYWYFSATIDTYLPSLCASILALGLALECLRDHRAVRYAWLGAAMGIAFLLRTDGFLLGPLACVAWLAPRGRARRLGTALGTALLVGGLGYAALARAFYDVSPLDAPSFALSHQERSRVERGKWGHLKNLAPRRFQDVLANHLVYAVVLPDTRRPLDRRVLRRMGRKAHGPLTLGVLLTFGGWLAAGLARQVHRARRAGRPELPVLLVVALLWLSLRVLFYTWWDPFDPFLFAVMDAPALWLLGLLFVAGPERPAVAPGGVDARLAAAALLTAVVYLHNLTVLIVPLQDKTVEKGSFRAAPMPAEMRAPLRR